MCLATSGRIVSLEEAGAVVETGGRQRWASTALFPDLQVGDYVLVSAVTILDRLSQDEAAAISNLSGAVLEVVNAER